MVFRALGFILSTALAASASIIACTTFSAADLDARADGDARDGDATDSSSDGDAPVTTCDQALASDPKNCGRCGHDCLGGTCVQGTCTPLQLAEGTAEAVAGLAVVAQRACWVTQTPGELRACNVGGCKAADVVATYSYPRSLAFDGSSLFIALGGSEKRIDRYDVDTQNSFVVAEPFAGPFDLHVDSENLYFIDQDQGTQRVSRTRRTARRS